MYGTPINNVGINTDNLYSSLNLEYLPPRKRVAYRRFRAGAMSTFKHTSFILINPYLHGVIGSFFHDKNIDIRLFIVSRFLQKALYFN